MKRTHLSRMAVLALLSLFSGVAFAHTGDHGATGFIGGLAHPVMGLDHLLAMIAVGLWASQQSGRARWAAPAAFVSAMALGAGLAATGWVVPHVESGIALSVLVLGLLVATRHAAPLLAGMSLVTVFALFHGTAHGLEMPQTGSPMLYVTGFLLSTLALHGVGMAAGRIGRYAMQAAGIGIAVSGMAMILGS